MIFWECKLLFNIFFPRSSSSHRTEKVEKAGEKVEKVAEKKEVKVEGVTERRSEEIVQLLDPKLKLEADDRHKKNKDHKHKKEKKEKKDKKEKKEKKDKKEKHDGKEKDEKKHRDKVMDHI